MKVFLTGATGYIGSAVTERLAAFGDAVSGLARSEESARKLERLGAAVVRGDLRDAPVIETAARQADAAIHLGFEFSTDAEAVDRAAVEALIRGMRASGKPLIYTSGIWVLGDTAGAEADENTPLNPAAAVVWRPGHELLVLLAELVRVIVIRPAMVYGRGGGFAAGFARAAMEGGVAQYVGAGENRWPFVHVDDLADLYVLALQAPAGSVYFASAGPALPVREVARAAAGDRPAEAIPLEQARRAMGPMADALVMDQAVSSRKAMRELGWNPKAKGVLEELRLFRGQATKPQNS